MNKLIINGQGHSNTPNVINYKKMLNNKSPYIQKENAKRFSTESLNVSLKSAIMFDLKLKSDSNEISNED